MDLWIATGNKGKLTEFKVLFNSLPDFKVRSSSELPVFSPPPENGKTYLENARIKTRAVKSIMKDQWVMGDDSGLEVIGLGNLPGVSSAVYAGPHASDGENRSKLLKMMKIRNIQDRSAVFKCCLIVYLPNNEEWIFEGELKGRIGIKESGGMGFGYDSIFIPEGETKTLAELEPGFKNSRSHRANATRQLIQKISETLI